MHLAGRGVAFDGPLSELMSKGEEPVVSPGENPDDGPGPCLAIVLLVEYTAENLSVGKLHPALGLNWAAPPPRLWLHHATVGVCASARGVS